MFASSFDSVETTKTIINIILLVFNTSALGALVYIWVRVYKQRREMIVRAGVVRLVILGVLLIPITAFFSWLVFLNASSFWEEKTPLDGIDDNRPTLSVCFIDVDQGDGTLINCGDVEQYWSNGDT